MLKVLANMKYINVKVIRRDNSLIDTRLSYSIKGNRKYTIYFRDSMLMLPLSLRKLGKNFNVEVKKGIYPYLFVNNKSINLDYIGTAPTFDNLKDITLEEYNNYANNYNSNWSLKKETFKYCDNDVISLWLIIKKFQIFIFRVFCVDSNNYPTLSSLAFTIYRVKYLKENTIPCIAGSLYNDLKESYTGGSLDVYKPIGENIYRYDVNSLDPSVMYNFPSPIGKIYIFKGNILNHSEGIDAFGFSMLK